MVLRLRVSIIILMFYFRMGKTIQMISLLVSDPGAKPNLVVA